MKFIYKLGWLMLSMGIITVYRIESALGDVTFTDGGSCWSVTTCSSLAAAYTDFFTDFALAKSDAEAKMKKQTRRFCSKGKFLSKCTINGTVYDRTKDSLKALLECIFDGGTSDCAACPGSGTNGGESMSTYTYFTTNQYIICSTMNIVDNSMLGQLMACRVYPYVPELGYSEGSVKEITDCYMAGSPMSYSDAYGSYVFTKDCYYTE